MLFTKKLRLIGVNSIAQKGIKRKMSTFRHFKEGHLVLPADLLFRFQEIFDSAQEFLVWQFFYFQNTSSLEAIAPSEIAQATGQDLMIINDLIEGLVEKGLLELKEISVAGEVDILFNAFPLFDRLEDLHQPQASLPLEETAPPLLENDLLQLVSDFERELGRMLSPFELEDLQQSLEEGTAADLIRAALREAVFSGKTNWRYIQAILRNWRREGITTVAQVEAKNAEREQVNPKQVTASAEFYDAMNLWKD